jgi:ribosomal protein S12 methylthiotransferase
MPLQHSEDSILKRMGRRTDKASIKTVIEKLRSVAPDICIRTTLITGFPGEDKDDFKAQCDFIEQIGFDRLGVFAYSREEGTPAYKLPNQVPDEIKEERKDYLLSLQKNISAEVCQKYVGKTLEVIVEGRIGDEENVYAGRSYRDCYEIDGFVFFECDRDLIAGDFYNVEITEAGDYDLVGKLREEVEQ